MPHPESPQTEPTHYTYGGLRNVWLANGFEIKNPFDDAVTFHDSDGQSIARWEKSGKVPRWADKLVRLLYADHAQGNEPICLVMERIKTVERIVKQRIVVQENRGHWTPSVQESADAVAA